MERAAGARSRFHRLTARVALPCRRRARDRVVRMRGAISGYDEGGPLEPMLRFGLQVGFRRRGMLERPAALPLLMDGPWPRTVSAHPRADAPFRFTGWVFGEEECSN